MSSLRLHARILTILSFALFFGSFAHAQATRTWISGVGDDVNPCSRTAPCKTFAGAISKTANGGEIDCMDPGSFGAVTITKSMTLDCSAAGGPGSTLASSGANGVTINAQPTDVVTIRNLSITGANSGANGVRFLAGATLNLENVQILQFATYGLWVNSSTPNAKLNLLNTIIHDNPDNGGTSSGLVVQATGGSFTANIVDSRIQRAGASCIALGAPIKMTIRNSSISNCGVGVNLTTSNVGVLLDSNVVSNNTTGLQAISGAIADIVNNSFSYNTFGLNANGGTIETLTPGSNSMVGNLIDGAPNANKAKI
jgi:hypothetical protein